MKNKPKVYSNSQYNLNDLHSDRKFEELIHRIFQYRINYDLKMFDDAQLMPGVAEKGTDVLLLTNGKRTGTIQCKLNTSGNITKPNAAKEIIKFGLFYYLDNSLIHEIESFKYYFICSGKFATTSIKLLTDFKNTILTEAELDNWIKQVLSSFTSFKKLNFSAVEIPLKQILSNLNIIPRSYNEINGWLNNFPEIISEFFEIKTVIETKSVEKNINKILEVLDPDKEKKIKPFLHAYYKSTQSHLNNVKFIGHAISFNRPRNITVAKLYVDPFLKLNKNQKKGESTLMTFNQQKEKYYRVHEVFKRSKHYVILGDPGAGKSLLVKNIILKLIKKTAKVGGLKNYISHIPFRIELRKYSEEKIKNNTCIIKHLTNTLRSEYQISNIEQETVEYIISNKPTIIFFDGLDEIFDTAKRHAVRDDIINFISIYKNIKCLITSRFVGYDDTPFPQEKFEEFSIQNFNDKQINKFIKKFYETQISNKVEREEEITKCESQIAEVDNQLKSNPLILSLMTLLAINKIVIPDSKLEVYRSCTNTLVETRDKEEKQLNFKLKVQNKRGTFGRLGYWQYNQMTSKKKVTQILAIKTIAGFLLEKKEFSDPLDAEEASTNFLEYAEKRSIYFDNNFMHKTFLEFYTADYIFTRFHNNFKIKERDEIINKHINNSAWHIVFELLIAMIDENVVDTDVLDALFNTHQNVKCKETNLFFLGLLPNTTNISSKIQILILKNCLTFIYKNKHDDSGYIDFTGKPHNLFNGVIKLLENEYFRKLTFSTFDKIRKEISNHSQLIDFYTLILEITNLQKPKLTDFISKSELKLMDKQKDKDLNLFRAFYYSQYPIKITKDVLINQVQLFGLESIYSSLALKFNPYSTWVPTFVFYISTIDLESPKKVIFDLEELDKNGVSFESMINKSKELEFYGTFNSQMKIKQIVSIILRSTNDFIIKLFKTILSNVPKKKISEACHDIEELKGYEKHLNSL